MTLSEKFAVAVKLSRAKRRVELAAFLRRERGDPAFRRRWSVFKKTVRAISAGVYDGMTYGRLDRVEKQRKELN